MHEEEFTVRTRSICGILVLIGAFALAWPSSVMAERRPMGDIRVFASVPEPGQPAGIALDAGRVWVSTLGLITHPVTEPVVFGYQAKSRKLRDTITVPRSMPVSAMALYGLAFDARGRLYAVDMNGTIVRINPTTGEQQTYATFTPSAGGLSAMPYDLAFDRAGNAYVTDQNLAGIWIVPPGGGEAQMWFQDPRLAGYLLGPTGIRFDLSGTHLYFTVASSQYPSTLRQGLVFRLPVADPQPDDLELVFSYPAGTSPWGLTFGKSGKLYVALSAGNQISILLPDGTEEMRFPTAEENAELEVPFDRPLGTALSSNGSLFVTNSSNLNNNVEHMVIFDVYVGDTAAPLARPAIR